MNKIIYFITGTGTDIGKTIVTAGLAHLSIKMGLKTAVVKPIQTGTDDYPSDPETIKKLVKGIHPLPPELECPCALRLAASPHLAAKAQGTEIDPEKIIQAIKKMEKLEDFDVLLLEGAGGLFVPINNDYMMIDLIKDLQVKIILAATAGLGTINHTLLSVEALQARNIDLAGIIINRMSQNPGVIEKDNLKTIEKHAQTPILATINEMDIKNPDFFRQFETERLKDQFKL
jgi:dethiobiotin synthase